MIGWVFLAGAIGMFAGYLFGYVAAKPIYYEHGYNDGEAAGRGHRKYPSNIEIKESRGDEQ